MRESSELEVVVHPLVLLSVVDHFRRCDEVRERRSDGWMDGWLDERMTMGSAIRTVMTDWVTDE